MIMSLSSLFSRKKLQKRGKEIFDKLVKQMQTNSAMLKDLVVAWADGNTNETEKLTKQIIEGERLSDTYKEELVETVLAKGAFLPYTTEDRFTLISYIDDIVDTTEDAARLIGVQVVPAEDIPRILTSLAEKVWLCTDKLQDSLKFLYEDFKKATAFGRDVEGIREEARDLYYKGLEKILGKPGQNPLLAIYLRSVALAILKVAIRAEETADFVKRLAVRLR